MKKIVKGFLISVLAVLAAGAFAATGFAMDPAGEPYYGAKSTFIRHAGYEMTQDDLQSFLGKYDFYGLAKKSTPKEIVSKYSMAIESGEYIAYATSDTNWDDFFGYPDWSSPKKMPIRIRLYYNLTVRVEGCEEGGLRCDGAALKPGRYISFDDRACKIYPIEVEGYESYITGAPAGDFTPKKDTTVTVVYVPTKVETKNASLKRSALTGDLKTVALDAISPEGVSGYDTAEVYYSAYIDGEHIAWSPVNDAPSDRDKHAFGKGDVEKIRVIYSDSKGKLPAVGGHAEIAFEYAPSGIAAYPGSTPLRDYTENPLTEEELFDILYDRESSVPGDLDFSDGWVSVEYRKDSISDWTPIKGNESSFNHAVWYAQATSKFLSFRLVFAGNDKYAGSTSGMVSLPFLKFLLSSAGPQAEEKTEEETGTAAATEAPVADEATASTFGGGNPAYIAAGAVILAGLGAALVYFVRKGQRKEKAEEKR